jgi:alpha-1,2-glucosyltransferase
MLYLWPYMLFFSWPIIAQSFLQGNITVCNTWSQVPRKVLLLGTMTNLAMGIVHSNTIIHPFTLADNRHYVFYVFRILLRDSAIKYLAAPVYVLSGYAVIQALGAQPQASQKQLKRTDSTAAPSGCRSSFVLVWLITTTLSLVTAPLVEPRYAIIAWIMWRMHVPVEAVRVRPERQDTAGESERGFGTQWRSIYGVIVETLWFLTIAVGTSYMFLYRGFGWPQEPGRIQRFMW